EQGRTGEAIDQPGFGDGLHPCTDERDQLSGEEEAEVAVLQGAHRIRESSVGHCVLDATRFAIAAVCNLKLKNATSQFGNHKSWQSQITIFGFADRSHCRCYDFIPETWPHPCCEEKGYGYRWWFWSRWPPSARRSTFADKPLLKPHACYLNLTPFSTLT